MITLLLRVLRLLPFLCGDHRQLALENLALHHQLAVYKNTVIRPKLRSSDRFFWSCLSRVWARWRQALVIVAPDTVLRWQRRRFRRHCAMLSGRPPAGRPPIDTEITALVRRMAEATPPAVPGVFAVGAPGLGDLHLQRPAVHFLALELLDREERKRAPETGSDEEGGPQRTDDRNRTS